MFSINTTTHGHGCNYLKRACSCSKLIDVEDNSEKVLAFVRGRPRCQLGHTLVLCEIHDNLDGVITGHTVRENIANAQLAFQPPFFSFFFETKIYICSLQKLPDMQRCAGFLENVQMVLSAMGSKFDTRLTKPNVDNFCRDEIF